MAKDKEVPVDLRLHALEEEINKYREIQLDLKELRSEVEKLAAKANTTLGWNQEDSLFLVWVLGFTAGANLDRDGERGERIFTRCRDLQTKLWARPQGQNAS